MEDKDITVPYIAFEGELARSERTIHRLWVLVIVAVVALLISNIAWILYTAQFEYYTETVTEVTQDSGEGGVNRFVGGDYYGEAESPDY